MKERILVGFDEKGAIIKIKRKPYTSIERDTEEDYNALLSLIEKGKCFDKLKIENERLKDKLSKLGCSNG